MPRLTATRIAAPPPISRPHCRAPGWLRPEVSSAAPRPEAVVTIVGSEPVGVADVGSTRLSCSDAVSAGGSGRGDEAVVSSCRLATAWASSRASIREPGSATEEPVSVHGSPAMRLIWSAATRDLVPHAGQAHSAPGRMNGERNGWAQDGQATS